MLRIKFSPNKTYSHLASGCLGLGLMMAMSSSPAQAIVPGVDNLSGGTNFANGSWTLGYQFKLDKTTFIDALGSYDENGDGLNGAYSIGLWDIAGTLLRTATVGPGTSNPLVSSFRWADIEDIALAPGDYIVASAGDWKSNNDNYYFSGSYTTNSLTYITSKYISGGSLQFPTLTYSDDNPAYFGGNVSIAVPSPFPLLGVGAALVSSRKLRKRIKIRNTSTLNDSIA